MSISFLNRFLMNSRTSRRRRLPRLFALETLEVRQLLSANPLASNSAAAQEVASFVQAKITDVNLAGVSVAVVRGDAVLMSAGYGTANFQLGKQVSPDTPFMIASVSKAVTAVAAMQLVDSGQLDLDLNINDYLPFDVANPNHSSTPITARMLMTHSSSITDNDTFSAIEYSDGDSPVALGDLMRGYLTPGDSYYSRQNFLQSAPGQSAEYSNMGTALLGYLVEEVSGQPFDQFSKQRIFDPLGMSNTSWKLAGLNANDVAMPYDYSGTNHIASGHYGFPDYPNGQLRSSANDMGKFLRAFIGEGELQGARILSAASVAEMRRLQIPNLDDSIGLMWYYDRINGQSILGHNGGETGANTFMFYRPSDGVGVIVFTNTSAANSRLQNDQDDAVTDIAAELFRQASAQAPCITASTPTSDVDESGTTATFTLKLDTAPSSNVVLRITSGDTGEISVSPATLTFTPANFATPQTVTLTGQPDDEVTDGNVSVSITASVDDARSDAAYRSVDDVSVNVVNRSHHSRHTFTLNGRGRASDFVDVASTTGNTNIDVELRGPDGTILSTGIDGRISLAGYPAGPYEVWVNDDAGSYNITPSSGLGSANGEPAAPLLDLDGDGNFAFSTDGILLLAYALGSRDEALESFRAPGDHRSGIQIQTAIEQLADALDFDADGQFQFSTDGIQLLAYTLGSRDDALTAFRGTDAIRSGPGISNRLKDLFRTASSPRQQTPGKSSVGVITPVAPITIENDVALILAAQEPNKNVTLVVDRNRSLVSESDFGNSVPARNGSGDHTQWITSQQSLDIFYSAEDDLDFDRPSLTIFESAR